MSPQFVVTVATKVFPSAVEASGRVSWAPVPSAVGGGSQPAAVGLQTSPYDDDPLDPLELAVIALRAQA